MTSRSAALITQEYNPNHRLPAYSNELLHASTIEPSAIEIQLTPNSNSNNVVQIFLTKPVAGTSNKIDNKAISKFIKTILDFKFLEDNWDGYGGRKINLRTIEDAIKLVKKLPLDKLPTRVGVSNDGEISIIWEKENLFADFGVNGDGEYCYFIKNKNKKLYGDELSLSDSIPKEALKFV